MMNLAHRSTSAMINIFLNLTLALLILSNQEVFASKFVKNQTLAQVKSLNKTIQKTYEEEVCFSDKGPCRLSPR